MSLTAWALVAAGAVTLLLCLYLLAKRVGRQEAEHERLQDNAEARTDADKEMDRIRRLTDDALNSELRK